MRNEKEQNIRNPLPGSDFICNQYTVLTEMVNQGKDDDYISVSVIVNDSSNTRWNAFREGLEQGAEDNQVHLNLVSTGSFRMFRRRIRL